MREAKEIGIFSATFKEYRMSRTVLNKKEALSILRQMPSSILFKSTDSNKVYASEYFEKDFGIIEPSGITSSSLTFYDPYSKKEILGRADPFLLVESGEQLAKQCRLQTQSRTMNCYIEGGMVNTSSGDWTVLHIKTNVTDLLNDSHKESAVSQHIAFNQLLTNFSSKLINSSVHELDGIIDQALAAFGAFCDVDRCYLFEFSDDGQKMSNTHEWAAAGVTPYIDELQNIPTDTMPFFISHISNGIFKVNDVSSIPDFAIEERQMFEEQRICSILCVRIMVDGTMYGFLGCDIIGSPYAWKAYDIEYLRRIGEILGNTLQNLHNRKALHKMQLELLEANQQLERLANIDGLTGTPNRRLFDATLKADIIRCNEQKIPLSLLLIDVDHFKQYNDFYGHVAGDAVLKSVAETLSNSCLGSDDLIARYGGEEFAVILPGTTSDSLATIAARILRNVTYLSIAHEKSQCSKTLTVSIGMVCLDWSETEPESMRGETKLSATSFLEKADAALYRAKNAGRNCAKF